MRDFIEKFKLCWNVASGDTRFYILVQSSEYYLLQTSRNRYERTLQAYKKITEANEKLAEAIDEEERHV